MKITDKKSFEHYESIKYGIILFILSFVLYANTLSNKFVFDDEGLIQNNRFITEGTTLKEIFATNYRYGANNEIDGLYRPLVMLSFVLNANNINPLPFHLINIFINALNAVLLFILIYILTGSQLTGFVAALVFSFHPLHTEAVANISGRPELMCAFFIFISYIFLEKSGNRLIFDLIAAFFLFLAVLSKETAVMFPFIVISIDFALKRPLIAKHSIRKYLFLFSAVIAYLIIRWLVLGKTMTGNEPMFLNNPIANSPVQERVGTAFYILYRYIILLLLPIKLSSDYSYNTLRIYDSLWHVLPFLTLIILIILFILSLVYRKNKPVYFMAFVFFIFSYLIVSNILFPIGTIMGERLMYLPSVGFALLFGASFTYFYKRWKLCSTVLIIILLGYSIKTFSRNSEWYDNYTLAKSDIKHYPENAKLLYNMGYHAYTRKQYDLAESYFNKSLEIYPEFKESLSGLGKMYYDQKQLKKSLYYYEQSKLVSTDDPELIFDYVAVLIYLNDFDKAESELIHSLEIVPDSQLLYRSMGNLKYTMSEYKSAIDNYKKSLTFGGDKRLLIPNIVAAYYLLGDYENAIDYVRISESNGIRLNPELLNAINAAGIDH
ncbi:hypothetical protein ACFL6H_05390 [Candidatus Latescibacterota bacterium]